MPYFQIKEFDAFLETCQSYIQQTQIEPNCISCGVAIKNRDTAFVRESYLGADGVIAHFQNVEQLLKEGLCKYGELLSLQIHGPPDDINALREDPMIQEMNADLYELIPGSFNVSREDGSQMPYDQGFGPVTYEQPMQVSYSAPPPIRQQQQQVVQTYVPTAQPMPAMQTYSPPPTYAAAPAPQYTGQSLASVQMQVPQAQMPVARMMVNGR